MLKIIIFPILFFFQQQHLTMTSIDYVPGSDSLKVFVKLDYNSFLKDYQQTVDDDLDIDQFRQEKLFPADLTIKYVNANVAIYTNGKLLTGTLLKMEKFEGNLNLNVLYRAKRKIVTMSVKNTFLNGLYSDVENLTIIKIEDFEKGVKFTPILTEQSFSVR